MNPQAIARKLINSHQQRLPFSPLAADERSSNLEDAYVIQDAFQAIRLQDGGPDETIVGYKIALTSPAMQAMVGVAQPCAGAIFSSVVHSSPAQIPLGSFQHVGVEFEVAVRLNSPLPAARTLHTRESVRDAIGECYACYELVEDRNANYANMDVFSLIADNCWNGAVVLGDAVADWQSVDFENGKTTLAINGEPAGEGRVGDALGHPFEAVAWLANLMNQRGRALENNMLVLTGSSITTKFPTAGDRFAFSVEGLGGVDLELT